ncbi:hypothetical protein MATL_G00054930 [Megalops atlanticus]|uniref:Insulin receptor substrate 2 n=1 Tax=Megalops atlanticus TaxID=7932 RepID=A0A9D3QFG0_MEGAT|nr:hypothetical protein MATL_G00054930 [Megalops atlanticus]
MDDYMAMTPNSSISPPQHIRSLSSEGYMLMSPSSSCSPDRHGMGALGVVWGGKSGVESRAGSDYMNMSPISVRSACSTPPPDSEQNPQPGTPKTVHSYFSLPRSYKHTLTTHVEDGPGEGRRAGGRGSNSRGGGGRGVGCSNRQESARGRHLSPSSSSYSSSSASTESLEDKLAAVGQRKGAGFRTVDVCSTGGVFQQRRGLGGQKQSQQQQRRNEPINLFADMSKASTLPRVRENPLPPVPQSPGEYVSIQFRGDAGGKGRGGRQRGLGHGLSLPRSPLGPMHRPDSSLVGFQTLPRSLSAPLTAAASEYMNMDFGLPPSPSPVSLTTFGFPSFSTPTTPPAVALKAQEECPMVPQEAEGAEVIRRKHGVTAPVTPELPSSCGDYTEMAFSSDSASPLPGVNPGPPSAHTSQASAMELSVDFPLPKASANPNQGARVIRADPQGRRRHCSESFLVSSPLPLSSSSSLSLFPEHTQTVPRQLRFEGAAWGSGPAVAAQCSSPAPPAAQALSVEQGLNYIDLDLASKESPHPALEVPAAIHPPPPRLFASFLGGGAGGNLGGGGGGCSVGSNLNTYASIDFLKSEELRTHQNTSKDSPECGS